MKTYSIHHIRSATLLGASILAIAPLGAQAWAADQQDQAATQQLQEIVVTAQHRSENLQKAALAVSVVSGDQLVARGVTNPDTLSRLVPSLVVQPTGGSGMNFYVRGVGGQGANPVNENTVAFAVDGVFIGRPSGVTGNFYDLERVEVLKGPQGTLYGRNATGGAINLVSAKPVLGANSGNMTFEYGNYNALKVAGAFNLSLGDKAALRIAGQTVSHDGYLSQGYDDENGKALRAQLLWRPSGRISALFSGDYFNQDGRGPGSVLAADPRLPNAPAPSARISGADPISVAALTAAFPTQLGNGTVQPPPLDGYNKGNTWGLSAKVDVELGLGTLTIIPAHRDSQPNFVGGRPGFYGYQAEINRQNSVEARLASHAGQPLTYVLGFYFFDQMQTSQSLFKQGTTQQTQTLWSNGTTSYAGFGQLTYAITPALRLVGGLRYTSESKDENVQQRNPTAASPNPAYQTYLGNETFTRLTWKAGFEFDAGPRNLIYGNVATGFKAGGISPATVNANYTPESLTAYTLGTKNRFFDNRLQVNLEAYYWDYRNQQVAALSPVQTSSGAYITAQQILNVGHARMFGLDAELQFKATARDLFNAIISYNNSKYQSFTYSVATANGAAPITGCAYSANSAVTLTAPAKSYVIDCTGMPGINAPKWSVNLGYEHTFPLPGDYALVASIQTAYQTGRYLSIDYLQTEYQSAATTSDASLTLQAPGKRWSLTGWVNNLEDAVIMNQAFNRPIINVVYTGLRPPRTFGVRANFRF